MSMRYREDSPLVIENVSVEIEPGKMTGVVGRTGVLSRRCYMYSVNMCCRIWQVIVLSNFVPHNGPC